MPPPTNTEELLERVRRSGIVPSTDLAAVDCAGLSPPDCLGRLVAAQLLTPFQADRLAAGKYKGFVLGSHIILDRLGGGGMGQVFLAEHTGMRRLAAVKVLPLPVADDTVARERFLREARAAAALDHPNIIRVFDLNKEGRLLYLVMEYAEGLTLQRLVDRAGPLPVGVAADYARQIALGLQHAHDRGLVHRDVKPSNVLVDREGTTKLLDLGLVRSEAEVDSKLTSSIGKNAILGTADYVAPEQALDSSAVDGRADVYSLGATLYFLLAGHTLFPTGGTAQKLMWQQWKDPTPIEELRPDVPVKLGAVIRRALAKKPDDRIPTPQAMADALEPFAAGPSPPPSELVPVPPPRRGLPRAGDSTRLRVTGTAPVLPRITPPAAPGFSATDPTPLPSALTRERPAPGPRPVEPVPPRRLVVPILAGVLVVGLLTLLAAMLALG